MRPERQRPADSLDVATIEGLPLADIEFGLHIIRALLGTNGSGSSSFPRSIVGSMEVEAQEKPPASQQPNGTGGTDVRDAPKPSRKKKLPRTIDRDEVAALLDACNLRTPTGLRDHCLMLTMYEAGLRIGETRRLRPRDVDLALGEIRVYDSKTGDGTAYFDPEGPLPDRLREWLRERRKLGAARDAPLFCTVRRPAGREIGERSVQQMMKRRAKRAGVDLARVTPHRLRHTFATELLNEGKSIYDVKELMRHEDLGSTEVYLHVRDVQLRAKMRGRRRSASRSTAG